MAWQPRQGFFLLLLLTLAFRFWLAANLPISGDEAYFIWWGQIPDWGFYDHPPMIGWWLAAMLKFGASEWWLRLPSVVQPAIIAVGIAAWLLPHGRNLAWGAASLVLLAPASIINVIITTDTPLIYFSAMAVLGWLYARRAEAEWRSPWRAYVFAGIGLAGAILSKYFAVFLGFAFLVDTLYRPSRQKSAGLILVYALTLPGIALMAWWNAGHCWTNVMFNFFNRHTEGNAGWSWTTPLMYIGTLLYVLTPAFFWQSFRQYRIVRALTNQREARALAILALLPLFLFGLMSLAKKVGLHWVLSFVPFALAWLACRLDERRLRSLVRFFVGFALLHMVVIIGLATQPLERWKDKSFYPGLILTFESQQLLDQLQPYADYNWMMDGYSNAVIMGYNTHVRTAGEPRYIGVFGPASSHARHDDILTDFRALDGRNIAILRKTAPGDNEYAPYFNSVEFKQFEIRGARFYLILGQGFNFAAYRDEILAPVRSQHYAIPAGLPQTACYFCDRYFPSLPCQR